MLAIDHATTGGLTPSAAMEQAETAPVSKGRAAEPGCLRIAETRGTLPPGRHHQCGHFRQDGLCQAGKGSGR